MNPTLLELPVALRRLVDNRLDTIEQMLVQSQTSRSERKSILDDLETQILDMVSSEAADREPTRADVLRVFAKLDPPEAFSSESAELPRVKMEKPKPTPEARTVLLAETKSRYTTTGVLACTGGLATLALALPTMLLLMLLSGSEVLATIGIVVLLLFGLPSLVLGISYAIAIRQSHGKLAGLTCAAIGISALPISLVFSGMFVLAFVAEDAILLIPACFFVTVFAIVGAIHLTYRALELFVRPTDSGA